MESNLVKELRSKDDLEEYFTQHSDKLVVIDFYAIWCGPCKRIAPQIRTLAEEMKDKVAFCKIDVDENEELVTEYEINSMPTFIIFKNKTVVGKVVGANLKKIQEIIDENL